MHDIPPGYGGPIQDPSINDVLSGRGGRINSHPGNVQFRQLVNQYKHVYLSKQTKKLEKVNVADKIVKTIRSMNPPGRFLKEDTKTQMWMEIGDQKARKKAGQAMRENADETRKELAEQETTESVLKSHEVAEEPNTRNEILQHTTRMMYPSVSVTNHVGGESSNMSPSSYPTYGQQQTLYTANCDVRNGPSAQYDEYQNPNVQVFAGGHFLQSPSSFAQGGFASMNTGIQQGHLGFGQTPSAGTMSNYGIQNNINLDNTNTNPSLSLQHANAIFPHDRYNINQQDYGMISQNVNANAFDRGMNTSGNSNSSSSGTKTANVSGTQSLNVSGYDSTKRSSSSSILSYISTGIWNSNNELLYLASQQQHPYHSQQQESEQQHQQHSQPQPQPQLQPQQYFGYPMNTLNGDSDWNRDMWERNLVASQELQYAHMENAHGKLGPVSETNIVSHSTSTQNKDRRRLFRENREKSQMSLSSGLKRAASNDDKKDFRESQLLKESIGTLDSMIFMDSNVNMSSMGMGSTNMVSMYPKSGNLDCGTNALSEQAPQDFVCDKVSGNEINPMTSNSESLMRVLAEAASKSERLSSDLSFQSSNERETLLSKSQDNSGGTSGSMPSTDFSRRRSFSSPSAAVGITSSIESRVGGAAAPSTSSENNDFTSNTHHNYEQIIPLGRQESRGCSSDTNPIDYRHQQLNAYEETQTDKMTDVGRMRAPPQKISTRRMSGISAKSDISMGDLSWNYDLGRLGSLQNTGDFDMNEARLRLFTESSNRSLMSDLSENMSALDLASLDMASRRDLLTSFVSNRRESIRRVNNLEAFQEFTETDDTEMDS